MKCFLFGLLVLCLSCLSCRPPARDRVWDVSARDLYRSYRDQSTRWTGQKVRVTLTAGDYTVSTRTVRWHPDRQTDSPGIVFDGTGTPDDAKSTVVVTGTVAGRVWTAPTVWHVLVSECDVREPK